LSPIDFGERTRAFLRVQDGCDAGCTFCIIPRIRGRSTSLSADQAVERACDLLDAGYREIILTGIHLGMYGHDRPGELPSLAGLVDAIHEAATVRGHAGGFRLRLSSIEPQEIDDALIDRIAAGRLVPHLHIPLQSGSDAVLTAMNRTYRAHEYDAVLSRLTARIDPIGLGADVIVGFPGETDADFQATHDFIAQRPFTYLHVFPFSPRPGTRAASLPGRPSGDVVDDRSARLRALSDQKRRAFAQRFVGREVDVLVEEPAGEDGWEGWSEHYVRIHLDSSAGDDLTGLLLRVPAPACSGVDEPLTKGQ
ncbi:MAG TPA: MiaB/RimO family radical SAM methylthiotransferase, partial [Candidatus Eisenbacteria bacterium]